jgi:hypothetical protein
LETRATQGADLVRTDFNIRNRAFAAQAQFGKTGQQPIKNRIVADYAAFHGVSIEEALEDFQTATTTNWSDMQRVIHGQQPSRDTLEKRNRYSGIIRNFGIKSLTQDWDHLTNNHVTNIGTQLSIHPGQDAADHGAPAQVRGPNE